MDDLDSSPQAFDNETLSVAESFLRDTIEGLLVEEEKLDGANLTIEDDIIITRQALSSQNSGILSLGNALLAPSNSISDDNGIINVSSGDVPLTESSAIEPIRSKVLESSHSTNNIHITNKPIKRTPRVTIGSSSLELSGSSLFNRDSKQIGRGQPIQRPKTTNTSTSRQVARAVPIDYRQELDRRSIKVKSSQRSKQLNYEGGALDNNDIKDSSSRINKLLPPNPGDLFSKRKNVTDTATPLDSTTSVQVQAIISDPSSTKPIDNDALFRDAAEMTNAQFASARKDVYRNMTSEDRSALKLGRLLLTSVLNQSHVTSDSVSRFFVDTWLSKFGSSTRQANSLSISLLCQMQKSVAEINHNAIFSLNHDLDPNDIQETINENDIDGSASYRRKLLTEKLSCALGLEAFDILIEEFGATNPVLNEIKDAILPAIFVNIDESHKNNSNFDADRQSHRNKSYETLDSSEVPIPQDSRQLSGKKYLQFQTWVDEIGDLKDLLREQNTSIADLHTENRLNYQRIEHDAHQIAKLQDRITADVRILTDVQLTYKSDLEGLAKIHDSKIQTLEHEMKRRNQQIATLQNDMKNKEQTLTEIKHLLLSQQAMNKKLDEDQAALKNNMVKMIETKVAESEQRTLELREQCDDLRNELNASKSKCSHLEEIIAAADKLRQSNAAEWKGIYDIQIRSLKEKFSVYAHDKRSPAHVDPIVTLLNRMEDQGNHLKIHSLSDPHQMAMQIIGALLLPWLECTSNLFLTENNKVIDLNKEKEHLLHDIANHQVKHVSEIIQLNQAHSAALSILETKCAEEQQLNLSVIERLKKDIVVKEEEKSLLRGTIGKLHIETEGLKSLTEEIRRKWKHEVDSFHLQATLLNNRLEMHAEDVAYFTRCDDVISLKINHQDLKNEVAICRGTIDQQKATIEELKLEILTFHEEREQQQSLVTSMQHDINQLNIKIEVMQERSAFQFQRAEQQFETVSFRCEELLMRYYLISTASKQLLIDFDKLSISFNDLKLQNDMNVNRAEQFLSMEKKCFEMESALEICHSEIVDLSRDICIKENDLFEREENLMRIHLFNTKYIQDLNENTRLIVNSCRHMLDSSKAAVASSSTNAVVANIDSLFLPGESSDRNSLAAHAVPTDVTRFTDAGGNSPVDDGDKGMINSSEINPNSSNGVNDDDNNNNGNSNNNHQNNSPQSDSHHNTNRTSNDKNNSSISNSNGNSQSNTNTNTKSNSNIKSHSISKSNSSTNTNINSNTNTNSNNNNSSHSNTNTNTNSNSNSNSNNGEQVKESAIYKKLLVKYGTLLDKYTTIIRTGKIDSESNEDETEEGSTINDGFPTIGSSRLSICSEDKASLGETSSLIEVANDQAVKPPPLAEKTRGVLGKCKKATEGSLLHPKANNLPSTLSLPLGESNEVSGGSHNDSQPHIDDLESPGSAISSSVAASKKERKVPGESNNLSKLVSNADRIRQEIKQARVKARQETKVDPYKLVQPFIGYIRQNEKVFAQETAEKSISLRESESLIDTTLGQLSKILFEVDPYDPKASDKYIESIKALRISVKEQKGWIFDRARFTEQIVEPNYDPIYTNSQLRMLASYKEAIAAEEVKANETNDTTVLSQMNDVASNLITTAKLSGGWHSQLYNLDGTISKSFDISVWPDADKIEILNEIVEFERKQNESLERYFQEVVAGLKSAGNAVRKELDVLKLSLQELQAEHRGSEIDQDLAIYRRVKQGLLEGKYGNSVTEIAYSSEDVKKLSDTIHAVVTILKQLSAAASMMNQPAKSVSDSSFYEEVLRRARKTSLEENESGVLHFNIASSTSPPRTPTQWQMRKNSLNTYSLSTVATGSNSTKDLGLTKTSKRILGEYEIKVEAANVTKSENTSINDNESRSSKSNFAKKQVEGRIGIAPFASIAADAVKLLPSFEEVNNNRLQPRNGKHLLLNHQKQLPVSGSVLQSNWHKTLRKSAVEEDTLDEASLSTAGGPGTDASQFMNFPAASKSLSMSILSKPMPLSFPQRTGNKSFVDNNVRDGWTKVLRIKRQEHAVQVKQFLNTKHLPEIRETLKEASQAMEVKSLEVQQVEQQQQLQEQGTSTQGSSMNMNLAEDRIDVDSLHRALYDACNDITLRVLFPLRQPQTAGVSVHGDMESDDKLKTGSNTDLISLLNLFPGSPSRFLSPRRKWKVGITDDVNDDTDMWSKEERDRVAKAAYDLVLGRTLPSYPSVFEAAFNGDVSDVAKRAKILNKKINRHINEARDLETKLKSLTENYTSGLPATVQFEDNDEQFDSYGNTNTSSRPATSSSLAQRSHNKSTRDLISLLREDEQREMSRTGIPPELSHAFIQHEIHMDEPSNNLQSTALPESSLSVITASSNGGKGHDEDHDDLDLDLDLDLGERDQVMDDSVFAGEYIGDVDSIISTAT